MFNINHIVCTGSLGTAATLTSSGEGRSSPKTEVPIHQPSASLAEESSWTCCASAVLHGMLLASKGWRLREPRNLCSAQGATETVGSP